MIKYCDILKRNLFQEKAQKLKLLTNLLWEVYLFAKMIGKMVKISQNF